MPDPPVKRHPNQTAFGLNKGTSCARFDSTRLRFSGVIFPMDDQPRVAGCHGDAFCSSSRDPLSHQRHQITRRCAGFSMHGAWWEAQMSQWRFSLTNRWVAIFKGGGTKKKKWLQGPGTFYHLEKWKTIKAE